MKRKTLGLKRSSSKRSRTSTTATATKTKKNTLNLDTNLTLQLGHVSLFSLQLQSSSSATNPPSSRFYKQIEEDGNQDGSVLDLENLDDKECNILSQDFFCTPDYITPDAQQISNTLDCNKENIPCPKSPEKMTLRSTKFRSAFSEVLSANAVLRSPISQQETELSSDAFGSNDLKTDATGTAKKQNFVSQSALALRCWVMPPPCISNPYLKDTGDMDVDPLGNQRSKSIAAGFVPSVSNVDGLSRYRTDFHEIEQIGYGHFSRVFKVLKRIDGCLYAVKHITRQLHQDTERRQALMEVQSLAALGSHENIVGYYSSWFENEQLFIQLELCDSSLSIKKSSQLFTERDVLEAMHQIAKALQFIHARGIAHLDVKPDNIYFKNGVYKLGDFGCATLIDQSLPIEEGDARYMPQEILNENYDHLDKVDIFSLGATIYELVKRSPLSDTGSQFLSLREGKIPLFPGHSMQFQNLLKVMVDPDPVRRPSAKELVENPIFDRFCRAARTT